MIRTARSWLGVAAAASSLSLLCCSLLTSLDDLAGGAPPIDADARSDADADPTREAASVEAAPPIDARADAAYVPGVPTVIAQSQNIPHAIVVDSDGVYWTNSGDGTVMAIGLPP